MYTPTLRVFAVLEILQSQRKISGKEIAERLEVDGRTVRRYMEQLKDLGIPVAGARGPDGYYQLQHGRRIPPIFFSGMEITAIVLGLFIIQSYRFPTDLAVLEGLLSKIERLLPAPLENQIQNLKNAIMIESPNPHVSSQKSLVPNFLALVSEAIQNKRSAEFQYATAAGAVSQRKVDIHGLLARDSHWYIGGYCHLRHDFRIFRTDRISKIKILKESQLRPNEGDVRHFFNNRFKNEIDYFDVEIRLKMNIESATRIFAPFEGTLEPVANETRFTCHTRYLEWIAVLLTRLDCELKIVKPKELIDVLTGLSRGSDRILKNTPN